MATLTVFTPAYNGAHTLPRVCASLMRQTSRDFVWLVVDDGSTDATPEVVASCRESVDFEIEYVSQENSGKHSAHNLAVTRAKTELFLILDADDELLPDAVLTITSEWHRMGPDERQRIAGIWTLSQTPDGALCGDAFPADVLDTSLQTMWYRHGRTGERLPCFTTAVLRQYPFPRTPPGVCPFIPEAYVWFAITRHHVIRFLNVPCRVYYPGGRLMTTARDEYRLSRCIVYGYLFPLAHDLEWFWHAPRWFLFNAAQTARYALFCGLLREITSGLSWRGRALVIAMLPLALLLLARDYASGRIPRSSPTLDARRETQRESARQKSI